MLRGLTKLYALSFTKFFLYSGPNKNRRTSLRIIFAQRSKLHFYNLVVFMGHFRLLAFLFRRLILFRANLLFISTYPALDMVIKATAEKTKQTALLQAHYMQGFFTNARLLFKSLNRSLRSFPTLVILVANIKENSLLVAEVLKYKFPLIGLVTPNSFLQQGSMIFPTGFKNSSLFFVYFILRMFSQLLTKSPYLTKI